MTRGESSEVIRFVLGHLNTRKMPPVVLDRLDSLIVKVEQEKAIMLDKAQTADQRRRVLDEYGLRQLRLLSCQLTREYVWRRASEESDNYRVFTTGQSLQNVSREDRWKVTRPEDGFVEVDLATAHLAIAQKLFGGRELRSLLERGEIWSELLGWIGYPEDAKPVLKEAIYAVVYGSSGLRQQTLLVRDTSARARLKQDMDHIQMALERAKKNRGLIQAAQGAKASILAELTRDHPGALVAHKTLTGHPAVSELVRERKKLEKTMCEEGGYADPFGVFHKQAKKISTTISAIASSYEKALLLPIYEAADKGTDFEVFLDQHDGLTLYFKRRDRQRSIMKRLKEAVQKRADELGIITHLEVKNGLAKQEETDEREYKRE